MQLVSHVRLPSPLLADNGSNSEAPPQTVEHVRVRLRLARTLQRLLARLRRGVDALKAARKLDSIARNLGLQDV